MDLECYDVVLLLSIGQLKVWGDRVGVEVIKQGSGSDPAAVMYDAVQAAKARNVSPAANR
ncbi:hypothetical protein ACT4UM_18860, partial [Bacillus sp. SS-TM]